MAIIQDRLSTTFVDEDYIPPEDTFRDILTVDYEGGPIAIGDTSQGINFQPWRLHYGIGGIIVLTPQVSGAPVTVLTVANCSQISFCFDQNGRPSVTYIVGGSAFLYWYNSYLGNFTTDSFAGIFSVLLSMDDKRVMQNSTSDMLWWYTKLTAPNVYTLFHRRQRDRFQTEFSMKVGCLPYMSRGGMHRGLRGKIATRAGIS